MGQMIGKQEVPHYSRDQVSGIIDQARQLVGELELDGDLKLAAFGKAVDLLAAKQLWFEPIGSGGVLLDRQGPTL